KPNFACAIVAETLGSPTWNTLIRHLPDAQRASQQRWAAKKQGKPPMYWIDTDEAERDALGNNITHNGAPNMGNSIYGEHDDKPSEAKPSEAETDFTKALRAALRDAKPSEANK